MILKKRAMTTSKRGRSDILPFENILFCFSIVFLISSSNVNAQSCSGTIRYVQNTTTSSLGAIPSTSAANEAACAAACTLDSTCLSYQLDTNPTTTALCWHQKTSLSSVRTDPNVVEKIKFCDTATSTCSGTIKYVQSKTNITSGATAFDSASNEAACATACTFDSTCLSYQLDSRLGTPSFCWLQKTSLSYVYPTHDVVEKIKYCDMNSCNYLQNSTLISVGATPSPALNEAACAAACTADTACLSYQIDNNSGTASFCWLQKSSLNITRPAANIIEKIKSCGQTTTTTVCQTNFQPNNTLVSIGAFSNDQFKTFEECRSACLTSPNCLSFQINVNPNQPFCWLQSLPNAFAAGTLYSYPDIVEYIKFTDCSTTTGCTEYGFIANGTTGWVTDGAKPYFNHVSRQECEADCQRSYRYCYSYQFSDNYGCSLQFNNVLLNSRFVNRPGYVEYIRKCYQNACAISYFTNSTLVSTGALTYPQLNTTASCQKACSVDATCLSYQIDTNPYRLSFCWLNFKNVVAGTLFAKAGVVEYFKQCV